MAERVRRVAQKRMTNKSSLLREIVAEWLKKYDAMP